LGEIAEVARFVLPVALPLSAPLPAVIPEETTLDLVNVVDFLPPNPAEEVEAVEEMAGMIPFAAASLPGALPLLAWIGTCVACGEKGWCGPDSHGACGPCRTWGHVRLFSPGEVFVVSVEEKKEPEQCAPLQQQQLLAPAGESVAWKAAGEIAAKSLHAAHQVAFALLEEDVLETAGIYNTQYGLYLERHKPALQSVAEAVAGMKDFLRKDTAENRGSVWEEMGKGKAVGSVGEDGYTLREEVYDIVWWLQDNLNAMEGTADQDGADFVDELGFLVELVGDCAWVEGVVRT
jgi:hypothetical protein